MVEGRNSYLATQHQPQSDAAVSSRGGSAFRAPHPKAAIVSPTSGFDRAGVFQATASLYQLELSSGVERKAKGYDDIRHGGRVQAGVGGADRVPI